MENLKYLFKNTKLNGYLIGDISILLAVLYLLFFKIPFLSKFAKGSLFVCLFLLSALSIFITLFTGKTYVKNKSKKSIFAKCENDKTVLEVKPGECLSYIDGISVNGVVYKLSDGSSVVVKEDDSIKLLSFGLTSYIGVSKCEELSSAPDLDWQPLFDKK